MNDSLRAEQADQFKRVQQVVNKWAHGHGFWGERSVGGFDHERPERIDNLVQSSKIALMHSELSEALEAVRKPCQDQHLVERSSLEVELADTVIRIMDFAEEFNLDVWGAIIDKHNFNLTRPYKHGKAF